MQLDVPEWASGSRAEWGANAGRITYAYAKSFLDSDSELYKTIVENRRTVECYFREFGAWNIEEIRGWSDRELVGVLVQAIAGDYRELQRYCEYEYPDESIEELMDIGEVGLPGNLYCCDGKWYFYVGS